MVLEQKLRAYIVRPQPQGQERINWSGGGFGNLQQGQSSTHWDHAFKHMSLGDILIQSTAVTYYWKSQIPPPFVLLSPFTCFPERIAFTFHFPTIEWSRWVQSTHQPYRARVGKSWSHCLL